MNAKLDHLTTLVVSSRGERGGIREEISTVPFSRKKTPDELLAYLLRLNTDMNERENVVNTCSPISQLSENQNDRILLFQIGFPYAVPTYVIH